MDYIELKINVSPANPWIDLLSAELGDIGFDSFESKDELLKAYISEDNYNQQRVDDVLDGYKSNCIINSEIETIETINWNSEWEKNFDPIFVDDKIVIKSSFHKIEKKYPYEILIDPKMSFGTGHHATTYLVMQKMLELDFDSKSVLDMGCGTAVLAVLAEQRGAVDILAVDINEWAYENSVENVSINNSSAVVKMGGSELLGSKQFNIILANINLNVLLADIQKYYDVLTYGGSIVFSGVLEHDKDKLKKKAVDIGLTFVEEKQLDKWMMFHFNKLE